MSRPRSYRRYLTVMVVLGVISQMPFVAGRSVAADGDAYQAMVTADWGAQERRKDRTPDAPEAIREALQRAERLMGDLQKMPEGPQLGSELAALNRLRGEGEQIESLNITARLALYLKVRSIARSAALKNPLIAGKPIVFMKRQRFICQMLHEYLGYYYDYGDISGGGVYVLDEPGRSGKVRDLIKGRLPRGNYTTLSLSYDARTVYFAFAERAEKKMDYYSPERRCFGIYAMDADGANLRRLTEGPDDDFDPCPLPDGGIAFMSTRRGGFIRCNNPWEPLPTHTLHRMDASGGAVQTLSFHETSEWHPWVLNDGRIAYCRWDYVDRSAANYHGIWVSNPDGSNPAILFGNYTRRSGDYRFYRDRYVRWFDRRRRGKGLYPYDRQSDGPLDWRRDAGGDSVGHYVNHRFPAPGQLVGIDGRFLPEGNKEERFGERGYSGRKNLRNHNFNHSIGPGAASE